MSIKETKIVIKDEIDEKAIDLISKSIDQFHAIIQNKIEQNEVRTSVYETLNIHCMISKMSIRWFNNIKSNLDELKQQKQIGLLNEDLDFMKNMFKFYYDHGVENKDKETYDRAVKILNSYRSLSLV